MTCRPRLLLADDHLATAQLVSALLEPEFEVIAHVSDGRALISAADRLSPDVIVSDISMPGLDGIAAASVILHKHPDMPIIFMTVHGDRHMVERGLATGARGYVLKVVAGDDLMPAVRAAMRGERHVSPGLNFSPASRESQNTR